MPVVLRITLYLLIAYILFLFVVFFTQRKLLYFPENTHWNSAPLLQTDLIAWPDEENFQGWISPADSATTKATAIVFHGNAGSALQRSYYARALNPLGYRVIIAEYPGYSGRPGKPSEQTIVVDAQALVARAKDSYGSPLYLIGESLGAGVAAATQADQNTADGIILITPWNNLPDLAQYHYPFLPIKWLLRDHYNSTNNLKGFSGPVAVVMAEKDQIIPNQFSMKLFENISSRKQLWIFKSAGHNSWPTGQQADWWEQAMLFIEQ